MKVVLLASGYGTRLGALTKDKPKPLVDLEGKPLIEHIVTRLAMHGLTDIIVNLHYLPHMLPAYLHERVLYYYEPKILGHKKTLAGLRGWLQGEDFMVVNADTITDIDYTDMIRFHSKVLQSVPHVTIAMDEYRATGTWIYKKEYFTTPLVHVPYRNDFTWTDAGTPERLLELKNKLLTESYDKET